MTSTTREYILYLLYERQDTANLGCQQWKSKKKTIFWTFLERNIQQSCHSGPVGKCWKCVTGCGVGQRSQIPLPRSTVRRRWKDWYYRLKRKILKRLNKRVRLFSKCKNKYCSKHTVSCHFCWKLGCLSWNKKNILMERNWSLSPCP